MVNQLIVTVIGICISMSLFKSGLNNITQQYMVICDQGLFVFEKCTEFKEPLIQNIYEDIYKCPTDQFVNDSTAYKIENSWTSEMYNSSHKLCAINLGKQGVTEDDFYYILENKCTLTPDIYATEKKALVQNINKYSEDESKKHITVNIYITNTTVIY